jgi:hypothetical protein
MLLIRFAIQSRAALSHFDFCIPLVLHLRTDKPLPVYSIASSALEFLDLRSRASSTFESGMIVCHGVRGQPDFCQLFLRQTLLWAFCIAMRSSPVFKSLKMGAASKSDNETGSDVVRIALCGLQTDSGQHFLTVSRK